MESIPYIFPVEPIEAQYLPLKTTKIKCKIDYHVIKKNDYGSLVDALIMDYQSVIRKLVETNGKPDRWLDVKLQHDCEEFVIFNIIAENGYKEIENTEKKFIYGHHFVLIFALSEDRENFNYKKVTQLIESWIKPKRNIFLLPCCANKKLSADEFDLPVQLYTDFDEEYQLRFNQIKHIFTISLEQAPYLIKITPFKERSAKSKEILIRAIKLLTKLYKVNNCITNNFPSCVNKNNKEYHRILSAKMSAYAITKATTRLSSAIRNRNLHKVAAYITSIYSNITIIEARLKHKFEKYFDKTRKFPKLSFADELLRCLKIVYEILRWNLVMYKNEWFYQWNELTRAKITAHESGNNPLGIAVTRRNFPPETFYSHFNGGNLFWAIFDVYDTSHVKDDVTDSDSDNTSSIVNNQSEPLLYFNNDEHNFGIITSPSSSSFTISRQISCGLLIDICQCGSDKIRYWICESCHSLITRLTNDRIICHCQRQNLSDVKKWCFQCMSTSHQPVQTKKCSSQVVSFAETKQDPSLLSGTSNNLALLPPSNNTAPNHDYSFPPSTPSTPTYTTKILIVQVKRERISNGHSTISLPSTNKTFSIPSKTTKSQASTVTLAVPETDESDASLSDDDVFDS